jgi:hypothetical protein
VTTDPTAGSLTDDLADGPAGGLLGITVPREHGGPDWKYHHVGNYLLNHFLPPNHGRL